MCTIAKPSREESLFLARVAEQAEDYSEMVLHLRRVIATADAKTLLSHDERSLFSVAYKNLVTPRRAALRMITYVHERETRKGHGRAVKLCEIERGKVRGDVVQTCEEVVQLINDHLLSDNLDPESQVFYHKMQADYLRYLTESLPSSPTSYPHSSAQSSFTAYHTAWTLALVHLPPTHPTRLGLARNFAVFYYDVWASPSRACHLAKHAFDSALEDLDGLSEEQYRDSTLIFQLLRDNIVLWSEEREEEEEEKTVVGEGMKKGELGQ